MKSFAMPIRNLRRAVLSAVPLMVLACAAPQPPTQTSAVVPKAWTASVPPESSPSNTPVLVPHQRSVLGLTQWWEGLGDSYLLRLIDKAQALSPTLGAAKARMAQARANQIQANAASGPLAQGTLGLSRGVGNVGDPVATGLIAAAQASWEIDLFGGIAATQASAQARMTGAQAAWHDARVSVAAEVAHAYFALKACERLHDVAHQQVSSLVESARLTDLLVDVGMAAPTLSTTLNVARLQGQSALLQARAQCTSVRIGLMGLTGADEEELKTATKAVPAQTLLDSVALPAVPSLPAQLLLQRPDVFSAEREVAAASHDVGARHAQRYPRLSLNGTLSGTRARIAGETGNFLTWSLGPIGIEIPLFDGGRSAAANDVAVAQYELAVVNYQTKVRQAVNEVEDALNRLQSTSELSPLTLAAAQKLMANQLAVQAKFDKGLASRGELEDARRQWLSAQANVYTLEKERVSAWIALYRALGGGWQTPPNAASGQVGTAVASH